MRGKGFTLVELLVTITVAMVLLGIGLSSFRTVIASTQTKVEADSLLSGLRLARSEAIKRNAPMRFQLVTNLMSTCDYSTSAGSWIVTQTNQSTTAPRGLIRNATTGFCNSAPYTPPDVPDFCSVSVTRPASNPTTCTDDPLIAYKSTEFPASTVTILADSTVITFGPLGSVLSNIPEASGSTPATLTQIDITSSVVGAKGWRIRISTPSGSLKLCDPDVTTTGAMGC